MIEDLEPVVPPPGKSNSPVLAESHTVPKPFTLETDHGFIPLRLFLYRIINAFYEIPAFDPIDDKAECFGGIRNGPLPR